METEGLHQIASPGAKELFALIQVFIVGAIIYWGGRKTISSFVKLRSENISKKIVDAKLELERIAFEADKARREIAGIQKTRDKMIDEVKKEGEELYKQLVLEAKNTADRILQESKLAARNEVSLAASELKKQVVEASIQAALGTLEESGSKETKSKIHRNLSSRIEGGN